MKAWINVNVYDFNHYQKDVYVLFDETIHEVGPMHAFKDKGYTIYDGKGLLLMPALVVGHTHIYSTFARGLSMPFNPSNFQEILDQLWWRLDGEIDAEITYYSGLVHAIDSVKNGVGTLIDHHASGRGIRGTLGVLKESVVNTVGLRGLFCFETSDRFNVDDAINENLTFFSQEETGYVGAHFGLHASMSLSEETLEQVSKVLKGRPIHIHVAESELDQADALEHYDERVIERLDRHQLLNKDSIIVHGLYLNDNELDIIKERECVVALNVSSNMNNGVGLPLYHKLKSRNIPVIIGNDGLSTTITTEYLTLLYAMHLNDKTPTKFGLDDLLWIIDNTYKYVSRRLGIQLGRIQVGYASDFNLVAYQAPTPMDESNAFGHLFYGMFHSYKPRHVFINGILVVRDYEVNPALMHKAKEAKKEARRLWKRLQEGA